ncbi:polysaccharide pyruvyl transferase family protein [Pseudomonas sp. LRP2-20]|uniref:polysaccharide pyruvyl transferase family protein n=1 Tax=Pseudomonas sp. LRP2-20 TaxID=2944234 RepID=UPI0021892331|nr:polysaccharide pyruvyl transferase family protein [Pseudomonas sp. LRP2-20]BDM24251.1 polysaccharide pyruvyl transferase family protein [Pseudomonas sp. LRP2-20]
MPNIFTFGLNESVAASHSIATPELYNLVGHNTGNLAFHYAINRIIGTVPRTVSWSTNPEIINSMGDIGIMPCANQLGTHMNMGGLANVFKQLKPNFVAIGLGAQGGVGHNDIPVLPEGTLAWLDALVARAASSHPNITVRGDYTLRVLDHYGFGDKAVSLGCPSLLINKATDHGVKLQELYKKKVSKVAIAAGHPNWKALSTLESSLVRMMEDTNGMYIVQATDEAVALSRNDFDSVNPEYIQKLKGYLKLNLDDSQFAQWIRKYFISFYNIPAWMEYLRRFDFVVGARIHGVMLAIQAGVPGLCIAHDSRIRELCEKCKIPFVMADAVKDGINVQDLQHLVEFDGQAFDKNRQIIAEQYQTFLQQNGIAKR